MATVNVMDDNKSVASFLDMIEREELKHNLKYLIFHDTLTLVYNRHYFEHGLNRLKAGRQVPVGLIICDLDGLKEVNYFQA